MLLTKKDLSRSGLLTIEWLRTQPLMLLGLFIFSFACDQFFEDLGRALAQSDLGPWPAQIGQFLTNSIEGMVLFLLGGFFLINVQRKMGGWEYLKKYTNPLTAESLRALTRVLLWSLVLILPGVVMYCRMMFLPFVIFFDPEYATHPDAVAITNTLTKKHWLQITLLVFAMSLGDGIFELIPNLLHIEDLVLRTCIALCGFVFSLFSFILLYMIFEHLMQGREKGS
jgi:hypothetical protein